MGICRQDTACASDALLAGVGSVCPKARLLWLMRNDYEIWPKGGKNILCGKGKVQSEQRQGR